MKKKLIAALVVAILLLIAAVGVVLYMELGNNEEPAGSVPAASESVPADTQQTQGTTVPGTDSEEADEETSAVSLPTENPEEVGPAYTWPEDETGSVETAAPVDPDATFDPDENETPEMEA